MKAQLYRGVLHYDKVTLHTASSGSVQGLDTLWLCLEENGVQGIGEVRLNIQYLHGYSETEVINNVYDVLSEWDWHLSSEEMLPLVHNSQIRLLSPGRMLFDLALHDLITRQAGKSVSEWSNPAEGVTSPIATNQTLFWGSNDQLISQAKSYVDRGFNDLKLRIAVNDFAQDFQRLTLLRETFDDAIKLAVDVNGQWSVSQAKTYLPELSHFNLSYVEQPVSPVDDKYLSQLVEFGIPIMLDESIQSESALERLIDGQYQGQIWAHLKLVKLGGLSPLLVAGLKLKQANVPFMIGQMNEGHVATAAAIQACRILQPQYAELYGADGLIDDPASGVLYNKGTADVDPNSFGLGVIFDNNKAVFLKEF